MAHIIAICNQKGGVGKTTTAINLSACLAAAEKKTLLIDMDPQGNATSGLGFDKRAIQKSSYDLLIGQDSPTELMLQTEIVHLKIIPANNELAGAEVELVPMLSREMRLKNALKLIANDFDYIIIDCPPSLGMLTLNAMTAAESLLIPVQCEYYAMEGMADLYRTVQLVREHLNPNLNVRGIVMTMFDGRNNLSNQVVNEVRAHFKETVFRVVIPRNVKLSEAPSYGKPIVLYDLESKGSQSYFALAAEVIELDNKAEGIEAKSEVDCPKSVVGSSEPEAVEQKDQEEDITEVSEITAAEKVEIEEGQENIN